VVAHHYGGGVAGTGLVHEALLYHHDEEYVAGALGFVRCALRAAEPVLVAVPEPQLSLLRSRIAANGRVRYLDMAVAGRNPNRIMPELIEAFLAEHHPQPVRVLGEPVYPGRLAEAVPGCFRQEAMVNIAFQQSRAHLLCPYDATALDAAVLYYAERTHPMVLDGPRRRRSRGYGDPHAVVAMLNQPLAEPRQVDAVLVFEGCHLAAVARVVADHAGRAGLTTARITDLQVAVHALAGDAVRGPSGGPATLRIWTNGGAFVCEIRGPGEAVDMLAGRTAPLPDSPWALALALANSACDLVQTHTSPAGTVTRLHMYTELSGT
jgi:MEDS: MEthanogen/methylotroph, DcmR Sensory domain